MGKILFRGFLGIAPIALTIILIVWIYNELEFIFGTPVKAIVGPHYYFSGLGVIVAVIVLFFVGFILNHWIIQRFYNWLERILKKIPLLSTIYSSISDLMSFFYAGQNQEKGRVVTVEINGLKIVGIITREQFDDLPKGIGAEGEIAVFFPFSYQIGGFTAIVPRSAVKVADFTIERGLRFTATAGNPSADKPTYSPAKDFKRRS